jgi:hypothetical protein
MPPEAALVRLDSHLVGDLPHAPEFMSVVSTIHEMADFYMTAAADPFSVAPPDVLRAHGASPFLIARSSLLYFNRLLYLRAAELLPDAVRALNDSRIVSFALATRGLLETAAVANFHAERLVLEEGATTLPGDYTDRLRAAVFAGRFDWRRLLTDPTNVQPLIDAYDADPGAQEPADAATNIVTIVDRLARRLRETISRARGTVRFHYSMLSDICHPSAGSNLVYFAGADPRLRAELVPQRVTVLGVATMLLPCLAYSASVLQNVLAELEDLDARLAGMDVPPPPGSSQENVGA